MVTSAVLYTKSQAHRASLPCLALLCPICAQYLHFSSQASAVIARGRVSVVAVAAAVRDLIKCWDSAHRKLPREPQVASLAVARYSCISVCVYAASIFHLHMQIPPCSQGFAAVTAAGPGGEAYQPEQPDSLTEQGAVVAILTPPLTPLPSVRPDLGVLDWATVPCCF